MYLCIYIHSSLNKSIIHTWSWKTPHVPRSFATFSRQGTATGISRPSCESFSCVCVPVCSLFVHRLWIRIHTSLPRTLNSTITWSWRAPQVPRSFATFSRHGTDIASSRSIYIASSSCIHLYLYLSLSKYYTHIVVKHAECSTEFRNILKIGISHCQFQFQFQIYIYSITLIHISGSIYLFTHG